MSTIELKWQNDRIYHWRHELISMKMFILFWEQSFSYKKR